MPYATWLWNGCCIRVANIKAGKFNEVQVVVCLLADKQGRPVGFDLFEGNQFEGQTLLDALEKLKKQFKIQQLSWLPTAARISIPIWRP